MSARVVLAEATKSIKVYFFSSRTIFWTLALPLANGLYLYFMYLPFAAETVNLQFSNKSYLVGLTGFTLVGQLLYTFFTMMLLAGASFEAERWQGTLETVLLTPASRIAILFGGALANALNYVWMLVAVVFSWIVFLQVGVVITDFLALSLSFLLSYTAIVALGMCLEAFFIYSRRGGMVVAWFQEPIMFLSGQIFPLQSMPVVLLPLSYLLPLTFGLISVRLTLLGGANLFEVAVPLGALVLMTAVFLVLAKYLVKHAERRAKYRANLAMF